MCFSMGSRLDGAHRVRLDELKRHRSDQKSAGESLVVHRGSAADEIVEPESSECLTHQLRRSFGRLPVPHHPRDE